MFIKMCDYACGILCYMKIFLMIHRNFVSHFLENYLYNKNLKKIGSILLYKK